MSSSTPLFSRAPKQDDSTTSNLYRKILVSVISAFLVAGALMSTSANPALASTSSNDSSTPSLRSASAASKAKRAATIRAKKTSVFVVGDSLTVGSRSSIASNLRKKTRSVRISAQVGRFTPQGVNILRSGQARKARVWVVALGTNDGANPGAMRKQVRKVMKLAKNRQVVWLTIVRPGSYERVNRMLISESRKKKNLTVANWAQVVRKNRKLLNGDRVHLTHRGYAVRGKFVASHAISVAKR